MLARLIAAPFWWLAKLFTGEFWKAEWDRQKKLSRLRADLEQAKWDLEVLRERLWDEEKQREKLEVRNRWLESRNTSLMLEAEVKEHGYSVRWLATSGPGMASLGLASQGTYNQFANERLQDRSIRLELEALAEIERNYVG